MGNLCEVELFPSPSPRSGMPRLPRKRMLDNIFTTGIAFLLLALSSLRDVVLGPEAKFSEIGTTRRDKGSCFFFVRYMYVDNEMR